MSVDGDALRRLADVVDDLGETTIDVDSARLLEADDETIRSQLTVTVPTEGDLEIATTDASVTESRATPPTNDDSNEQGVDDRKDQESAGSDDTGDAYLECDVDGCDFTTNSERGLAIHEGQAHGEAEREAPIEDRILNILEKEGEVSSSEVQLLLETSSDHYRNKLSQLQRDGKVESRQDPDDGRRRLYRLAGDPVEDDDEEAPEEGDAENGDTEKDPFIAASRKARKQEQAQESEEHDSGTSTEDDTPAQKSESESEARSVDLEEDAADDSPDQDAGDDVHVDADHEDKDADEQGDETTDDVEGDENESMGFPRDCHCGATLEDSLELAVHRTEVHGVPQGTLDHLDPGEFEEIVRDAATLQDILDATGWSPERTLRALGVYGLADVVGPDGIELSDLDDYEFEGIGQPTDTPDPEADVIDESEGPSPRPVANDGGAVAFQDYSASSGTGRRCQNCGAHVDKQFAKVFEPEHEGAPRACPNCEDLVREGDGTIRQKRTGGGA